MIEEAQKIAAAAETAAKEAGLSIVVSIVDTHGNPVLLYRMDGAPLHSLDMAFRKAYTAASFDVATEELTDQVQPGQPCTDSPSTQEANSLPSAAAHPPAS